MAENKESENTKYLGAIVPERFFRAVKIELAHKDMTLKDGIIEALCNFLDIDADGNKIELEV